MVQEIINHNYDVKDDDGEILYQNVAISQEPQSAEGHMYENAAVIQQICGEFLTPKFHLLLHSQNFDVYLI